MKTTIIKATLSDTHTNNNSKLEAFTRLEASRQATTETVDYEAEREDAMNKNSVLLIDTNILLNSITGSINALSCVINDTSKNAVNDCILHIYQTSL